MSLLLFKPISSWTPGQTSVCAYAARHGFLTVVETPLKGCIRVMRVDCDTYLLGFESSSVLPNCATLGQLLNLSELWFLHL